MRIAIVVLVACGHAPAAPLANREPAATITDRDGDWIADSADRCPDQPEDFDVFADDDGCPDPDDDGDGVLDEADRCPYHGGPAPAGCPPGCTFATDIDDCFEDGVVWFEGGVPASDRVADAIAILRTRKEIAQVRVGGFREPGEPAARSLERAQRVRTRIVAAGIAASRVVAADAGVDSASTLVGYARRVSISIAKQRFSPGKFRAVECTLIGSIHVPAKVTYSCP